MSENPEFNADLYPYGVWCPSCGEPMNVEAEHLSECVWELDESCTCGYKNHYQVEWLPETERATAR